MDRCHAVSVRIRAGRRSRFLNSTYRRQRVARGRTICENLMRIRAGNQHKGTVVIRAASAFALLLLFAGITVVVLWLQLRQGVAGALRTGEE